MTSITPFARKLKDERQQFNPTVDLVTTRAVEGACAAAGHRWRPCFWTPTVTILTFLRQILHANCSCRQAVALTLAASANRAEDDTVAGDPSAYSQARQKLPGAVLGALNVRFVHEVQAHVSSSTLWCGRRVRVVDGSSASMPDTPELQRAFPQPSAQKPGCGFPVARLLAIFCWASGSLLDLVADSLHVSELALLRRLLDRMEAGTVLLADAYFSSYYDLALLRQHGLDGVYRLHARRPTDLRRGTRLGRGDHCVTWTKPKILPRGVSADEWAAIPESLTVRHVRVRVAERGFRGRSLNLVTTLLDPTAFPAAELAKLYRDRWMAELNLRSLKTTLGMEVLRCQSPEMVRKELAVYQLAYNLIRLLMWRAAQTHRVDPRRLSFAGTQQRVLAILPFSEMGRSGIPPTVLAARLLAWIAADRVPDRPDRFEPRCVKRRPKQYTFLTRPRHQYRCRTDDQWR